MSNHCYLCSNFTDEKDLVHLCKTCFGTLTEKTDEELVKQIARDQVLLDTAMDQVNRCLVMLDSLNRAILNED